MENNQTITVVPHSFEKSIEVPSSKSYCNRLLILASIYPGTITIENIAPSLDVKLLIESLKVIGLKIQELGRTLIVENSFPSCETISDKIIDLFTGEGGTTNRFLIALLLRGKNKYRIHASGSILQRPMKDFYNLLSEYKAKISLIESNSNFPVILQGPLIFHKKQIIVNSSFTSQYLSSLMLAFADTSLEFIPENLSSSESYFHMTRNLIKIFHYELSQGNNTFTAPIDFSSITYPIALGIFFGPVIIRNCEFIDLLQPDSKFISIVNEMGGSIKMTNEGLLVQKLSSENQLQGITIDCKDTPDLVPALLFLCSYAKTPSLLYHLKSLQFKESRRIDELLKLLNEFSVKHSYDEIKDELFIYGSAPNVLPKELSVVDDHRIVMTSYLFLRKNQGGRLNNINCVNKSFPRFFKIME